ncbi:MAG: ROK family protein, partial [Candidatus Omnitrophica bacterium]|nr:ROK family protein [Candidatus Omnitrophota bacterium]
DCLLKRWEMDLGIIEDIKLELSKSKDEAATFFKITSANIDNVDLKSVFIANRMGHNIVTSCLDRAAKRLGIKIASLVNLLNPEMVVIGGGLEDAGDDFLNRVISTVKDWAFRECTEDLKIMYSRLRENAVALGAGSLVMQRIFAKLD